MEADIVKMLDVVAARGANRVAGQMLADLRQLFRFAVRRRLAQFNPTDDLSKKEWNGEAATSLRLRGGKWNSHDLRRTAATLMQTMEVGAPPHVIEAVLNHAEPNRMKRIYQHHKYRDEMRDAWLRLGAHLDKLMRKKLPTTTESN